jgi:hypothetical protein
MNALVLHTTAAQPGLLRRTLMVDGVVVAGSGLLLALAAGPLGDLFDLPVLLLRLAGIGLLPYGAAVLYVATRATIPRRGARAISILNLLWAAASLLLLVNGWVDPSRIGIVFVIVQALIVIAIADLQCRGLRRPNA